MPKVTGCGEIEEIERGKVYRIRHHLGRDPKTGRYLRSPKRTVHGTKSDARRALEEYRRELEEGFANPENLTVPELGWRWHEQRKLLKDLSPLTHATDECELRKVERWFGGILVSDLSLSLLNMVYSSMREDHGVSQRGVHKLNAVLSQVMDLAVKERLVKHNPCRDVDVSRPRSAERTPLTLDEAIALCQALRSEGFDGRRVAVWLALATGVRRGEALGLTWRYVDFENRRIYIKYQYTRDKKLRETKNKRSRWIAVDDGTVAYLRTWRAVQARRMQVQGLAQAPDTPVCSDDAFGLHDPDNFSAWQRGYFVEHGLGRIEEPEEGGRKRRRYVGYDFHELRHTQATFLIGNGIDPKSVQGRLGHEVSSMTMDVYAHTIGGNDREAADLMGRLLMTGGEGAGDAQGEADAAGEPEGTPAAPAAAGAEPVRLTVVGPDPDSRPCPGARLVERGVVRDGRTVWVEEWRVTVSSVGELLELQRGLGVPVLLEGGRLTVMAKSA